tara:strand:- start:18880 stop:19584 length:705 start_codon:yes stop_codon:yes gene_type:complete
MQNQAQNLATAEYFFNNDPGIGNGIALSLDTNSGQLTQSFSINTSSLSNGFNSLYIRIQDSNGSWSLYDRALFYINEFSFLPADIIIAEYFIDNDPGVGNGISINISSNPQTLSIDTEGISEGMHQFCIRIQNENGIWSLYECENFEIGSFSIQDILLDQIFITPNPFDDQIQINSPMSLVGQNAEIFTVNGQHVMKTLVDSNNIIFCEGLESGVYILKVTFSDKTKSFKIIKN